MTNRSLSLHYAPDKILELRTRIIGDLFLESKSKANELIRFDIIMPIKATVCYAKNLTLQVLRESLSLQPTTFMYSSSIFMLFRVFFFFFDNFEFNLQYFMGYS